MATQLSPLAIGGAVVGLIAGVLGINKSWNDAIEARMTAERTLSDAKLKCAERVEALNEAWRDRVGKP
jgi:hypothetical protein